jgi:hypothetical protein
MKNNKDTYTQEEFINELNYLVAEGFVEEFKPGHYRLTKEAIDMGVAG